MAGLRDIEAIIKRKLDELIPQSNLNLAVRAMGEEHIKLTRQQINSGIGGDGKRIPKLSNSYTKFKKRFINGTLNLGTRKPKKGYKASYKRFLDDMNTGTEYTAKSTPNYGRLTGQLFSAMAYKVQEAKEKNGTISLKYTFDILNPKRKRIWQYLQDKKRYYELCLNNTARGNSNKNKLLKVGLKILFPKANFFDGRINAK